VLRVEDLYTSYGEVAVISGVDLLAERGKIISLLGSNCSGKSTLLNSISGLIAPVSGKIIFENSEITGMKPHDIVLKGIAQVPEGRRIFPNMTVLDNLRVAMWAASTPEKEIAKIFELFPFLRNRTKQIATTLSGGEQQVLAISRALLLKPRLLMLDEPSLGLAPLIVKETFQIIRRLRDEGITILVVEQNVKQSLDICDYVYILAKGRIVIEGKSEDLFHNDHIRKVYLGI